MLTLLVVLAWASLPAAAAFVAGSLSGRTGCMIPAALVVSVPLTVLFTRRMMADIEASTLAIVVLSVVSSAFAFTLAALAGFVAIGMRHVR